MSEESLADAAARRGWAFSPPRDATPWGALAAVGAAGGLPGPRARVPFHQFLRHCAGQGWVFEPVTGALFTGAHSAVVARHGGASRWLGLGVALTADREAVATVRWVHDRSMASLSAHGRIASGSALACDWLLLFVRPSDSHFPSAECEG